MKLNLLVTDPVSDWLPSYLYGIVFPMYVLRIGKDSYPEVEILFLQIGHAATVSGRV